MSNGLPGPNIARSIWAIFAGFLLNFALSTGVDVAFHATKVYPPWGEIMSNGLFALALSYRLLFGVAANVLIHRLAPWRPMKHVWIAAGIGFVVSLGGVYLSVAKGMGPVWYPLALALSVVPLAFLTPAADRMLRGGTSVNA